MNGGVRTIDDVMKAHSDFLDECLKECLLTDQNLFRILTRLNQNNNFFARIIQRFFNQLGANETHERVLAENELYGAYSKMYRDEEEEKTGNVDSLAMKRRQERIAKKSEALRVAFQENSYSKVVDKFQKQFNENMRELLQVLTREKRYETHIANLSTRLDYNGYYSQLFSDDIDVMIYPKHHT